MEAIDAIEANEPGISEKGMILASCGTGFIGSNFEFDGLSQSDEEIVSFDEFVCNPSGSRQRIKCV